MHPFARDNAAIVQQGIELLENIDDDLYASTLPPVFASSIGAHIRHILDHFECLLGGLATGSVDYDQRRREPRIESDRRHAIAGLRRLAGQLETLASDIGGRPLKVKMDGGGVDDALTWSQSSVTRELQFLTSHTIHHYALVAAILSQAGHPPDDGFGVSPSTLSYEKKRALAH